MIIYSLQYLASIEREEEGNINLKLLILKLRMEEKIKVIIPNDIDRAVGSGARDIVNYAGLIMRSSISFQDGN